jgi:spore germination protein GerM
MMLADYERWWIMRMLRAGAVLGLLVVSACGTSDDASSTVATEPAPVVTTIDASTVTTENPTTEVPATDITEPSATQPPTTPAATAPAPTTSTTAAPTTTVPALTDVKIYVLREERLATVHRDVTGPAVLRESLAELLAGPTPDELASGLHSEIPADTALLDVALTDGIARVDLDSRFESGGGTLSMNARIAQVVFTATQFDNVDRVLFLMNGAPIDFLGGEGIVLSDPQTRSTVDRAFTGGIIVDTPVPGATVGNPFIVTGEGDVFEADFPIEVWANGVRVYIAPVMAGAWGEWADFDTTITLDVPAGPIELIAYDAAGCGPPECPVIRTIVPLTFTG